MLNHKKLIELAKKWSHLAKNGNGASGRTDQRGGRTCKGHVMVYTVDERRFVVPLAYLSSSIFKELFDMAEEVFGLLPRDGPITMPCDADFMDHVVSSLGREDSEVYEKTLLSFIAVSRCSNSLHGRENHQHQMLYSF